MSTKNKKDKGVSIKPLSDRVVLKEIELSDTRTASGIIIPDSASDEKDTKKGQVVAVGEGRMIDGKLQKPSVKIGDTVLYSWGDKIIVNGEKFIIVGADNISAIIE
jgi:chaperonin GroES